MQAKEREAEMTPVPSREASRVEEDVPSDLPTRATSRVSFMREDDDLPTRMMSTPEDAPMRMMSAPEGAPMRMTSGVPTRMTSAAPGRMTSGRLGMQSMGEDAPVRMMSRRDDVSRQVSSLAFDMTSQIWVVQDEDVPAELPEEEAGGASAPRTHICGVRIGNTAKLWMLISIASIISAFVTLGCSVMSSLISSAVLKAMTLADDSRMQFLIRLVLQVTLAVLAYAAAIYFTAPSKKQIGQFAGGSGIPEMKTELGGVHLTGMFSARILVAKWFGLSLATGAGLPVGSEGPFVHLAGCIGYICMNWIPYFHSVSRDRNMRTTAITAMVAVGVACAFSAPVGGVFYALEVTDSFGTSAYIPCFFGSTIASLVTDALRSMEPSNESMFYTEQLLETDIDPLELNYMTEWALTGHLFPFYVLLGLVCGLLGAAFVRCHRLWVQQVGRMVAWAGTPRRPRAPVSSGPGPQLEGDGSAQHLDAQDQQWQDGVRGLMEEDSYSDRSTSSPTSTPSSQPPPPPVPLEWRKKVFMAMLVACLAALNSSLTWSVPLLREGQAKILYELASSAEPEYGVFSGGQQVSDMYMLPLCLAIKMLTTTLVLGLPLPMGSIAPTMIVGAFVGRYFGFMVKSIDDSSALDQLFGGNGTTADLLSLGSIPGLEEQILGRFALLGASALTSGAMRSFAQVVLVYALTGLPEMLLPLCISSLTAIFVANRLEIGFFDSVIKVKKLPHLAALAQGREALSVAQVMVRDIPVLSQKASRREIMEVRDKYPDWACEVPVVVKREGGRPVLLSAVKPLPHDTEDLDDVMTSVIVPFQVPPHVELKDLLPIFALLGKTVAFVTMDGKLVGAVTLQNLKARVASR